MKYFLLILACLALSVQAIDVATTTDCSFYQNVEKIVNCKDAGYPIGYGFKYCTAFNKHKFDTEIAKEWMRDTMHRLQLLLQAYLKGKTKVDCNDLYKAAFDSHPRAYTNIPSMDQGKSICDLIRFNVDKLQDIYGVMTTVDTTDLIKRESLRQIAIVAKRCGVQLVGKVAEATEEYAKSSWNKVKSFFGFNFRRKQLAPAQN